MDGVSGSGRIVDRKISAICRERLRGRVWNTKYNDINEGYKGISDSKWYKWKISDRWGEQTWVVCKDEPPIKYITFGSKRWLGNGKQWINGSIIVLCTWKWSVWSCWRNERKCGWIGFCCGIALDNKVESSMVNKLKAFL